jgi:4-hydroxy-3-polyprenylbenzoate decarboxylase
LHLGHLKNMLSVTEMGAILVPPVVSFYLRPQSVLEVVDHTVGKVLELFGLEHALFRRWG